MENKEIELLDISTHGLPLVYIKRGVLWVEKKPYYIVELVKEPEVTYVVAYGVQKGTEDNPQKAMKEVKVETNTFSTQTRLGQIASQLLPRKKQIKFVPKQPLFIAPVIPNQIATLTGKRESGFFEREPDRVTTVGGEIKYLRGKNTGVFIGLSSISWEDKVIIPPDSILKTINQYKQDLFFDFTGNNEDTNNPLSRYYRDGE